MKRVANDVSCPNTDCAPPTSKGLRSCTILIKSFTILTITLMDSDTRILVMPSRSNQYEKSPRIILMRRKLPMSILKKYMTYLSETALSSTPKPRQGRWVRMDESRNWRKETVEARQCKGLIVLTFHPRGPEKRPKSILTFDKLSFLSSQYCSRSDPRRSLQRLPPTGASSRFFILTSHLTVADKRM